MADGPITPEQIVTKPLVFKVAPVEGVDIKKLREDVLGNKPNEKPSLTPAESPPDVNQIRKDVLGGEEKGTSNGGWEEGQLNAVPANEELAKRNKVIEEQQKQIGIDPLTGAKNRAEFISTLSTMEEENRMVFLAMCDIDNFKEKNDKYGHLAGDEVLKILTQRLKSHISQNKGDDIFRFGGEEFAIVIQSYGQPEQDVAQRVEELRKDIAKDNFMIDVNGEKMNIPVTISIGLANKRSGETGGQLTARADRALYDAKESGRNKVVLAKTY